MTCTSPRALFRAEPRPLSSRLWHVRQWPQILYYSTRAEASKSSTGDHPPAQPPPTGRTPVPNRRLISIHGPDAPAFLNGLSTASVSEPSSSSPDAFYNAFLNAQGRVLSEGFTWRVGRFGEFQKWLAGVDSDAGSVARRKAEWQAGDPAFLLEVDSAMIKQLYEHLRRHKLRAKLGLRVVEEGEWDVWAAWTQKDSVYQGFNEAERPDQLTRPDEESSESSPPFMLIRDNRAPGLGYRLLLPPPVCAAGFTVIDPSYLHLNASSNLEKQLPSFRRAPQSAYTIRRQLAGVPEGVKEIVPTSALPQESGLDVMGAVDFKKGCYVGQELTIRTHHTGVVRKRILPCVLYKDNKHPDMPIYEPESARTAAEEDIGTSITPGTDIRKITQNGARARAPGRWLSGQGNIGLALCRVENMTDVRITEEGGGFLETDEFALNWTSKSQAESAAPTQQEVLIKAFVPAWQRSQFRAMKPRTKT